MAAAKRKTTASNRRPAQSRKPAPRPRPKTRNRALIEWRNALIRAAIIAFALFFVLWPAKIGGPAMRETFGSSDNALISRFAVFFGKLHRFDIVVCKTSDGRVEYNDTVRRVIGLPGDRVEISGGEIRINGVLLHEPYLNGGPTPGDIDVRLGADEYYILGDNRDNCRDSRDFGPIKKNAITGKVVFRYFPLNKLKFY